MPSVLRKWKLFVWRHPEWWTLALSAAVWAWFLWNAFTPGPHAHHAAQRSPSESWLHWQLMIVAMMLPLVSTQVNGTAGRSLWRRRHRAISGFLLGYLARWGVAGLVILGTVWALQQVGWGPGPWAAAAGFVLAAAWQLTPIKKRAAVSCHATMPLAPQGWHADRDCARYGWRMGGPCVLSCWALMFACSLAGHSLAAMTAATAAGGLERYRARLDARVLAGAFVMFGLGYALTTST